jgi:hypothetical protein
MVHMLSLLNVVDTSATEMPGAPAAGNGARGQLPARPQTGRSSATQPTEAAPRVPLFPDRPIE